MPAESSEVVVELTEKFPGKVEYSSNILRIPIYRHEMDHVFMIYARRLGGNNETVYVPGPAEVKFVALYLAKKQAAVYKYAEGYITETEYTAQLSLLKALLPAEMQDDPTQFGL